MLVVTISVALAAVLSVGSTQNANLTCGNPPDVPFSAISKVTDEEYPLGTIVTYGCQNGYRFSGESRTIFCDETDTKDVVKWTEPSFFCSPQSCGDPGYINNGRRVGYRFTFPNSVKYECDEGYRLKGLPTRYCQASGLWSGRLPACKVLTCNEPKEIANAHITYNSLEYMSELRYECNKGFKLNSDETVYCTAEGLWSKNDVECIESTCDFPVAPNHGTVHLSDPSNVPRSGTFAIYACEGERIPYGPVRSKCLDNGQWLFPAPECLPPCSLPNISNGKIGQYQKRTRWGAPTFQELPSGERVEDDQELILRCSLGYEAGNPPQRESKISCRRGMWLLEPHCKPTSCLRNPPRLQNAEIVNVNSEHGGEATYRCLQGFKQVSDEKVVCNLGTWKGYPRICESTSCSKDKLNFSGLRKGYQSSYEDGDIFKITCEKGYQVNGTVELRCSDGEWKSNSPPCMPADCTEPPAIPNTYVEKDSTSHGSYVSYVCKDPYKLIGESRVQCWLGEWKNLPRCDDGRCDIQDLKHSSHISLEETPRYVNSGEELHVTCKAGYSPRLVKPYCLEKEWIRNTKSPCKEDECLVPKLANGDILELWLGEPYWHFWKAKYVQDVFKTEVPFGTLDAPGKSYLMECHSGYSFRGSSDVTRKITCSMGKWYPTPVCILKGTKFVDTETTTILPETTSVPLTTQSQKPLDLEVQPEEVTTEDPVTVKPVECPCQYLVNDTSLVATVDGRQLHYLDTVKDGSVVVYRCQHVGYHRFTGSREMKCENCKTWHLSEFPTCAKPSRGDTIIVFDRATNISHEGNLEVKRGEDLSLVCISYESGAFPKWLVPTLDGVTFSNEKKARGNNILYMTHINIENAALENEGAYHCSSETNSTTGSTVDVIVFDPNVRCPEFQDDDIHIFYKNERRVKSKATFSCKYQGQELIGKSVLKCLTNGNWSDPQPECHEKKCKILEETELLKIVYRGDRAIGSSVTFNCSEGSIRTGVDSAHCRENGLWSHPAPTCNYPPCVIKYLVSSLPKEVTVDIRNIQGTTLPHDATITFTCADDLIAIGDTTANCKHGIWKMQAFQCLSGCPSLEKNPGSQLEVTPMKDTYNFGESVQFFCPPGMDLTMDLQLITCMKHGWSETILPDCKEKEKLPEAEA